MNLSRRAKSQLKKDAHAAGIPYEPAPSAKFVSKEDRPLPDPAVASLKALIDHYDPSWGLTACETAVVASTALPRSAPLFTADSNYFFHAVGKTLRLHSVDTLLPLSTLSSKNIPNGHTQRITSVHLNPSNALQVVTSSYDGTVKFWDYLDATCLRTVVCPGPVTHLIPGVGASKGAWFAVVMILPTVRKKKDGSDKFDKNQNGLPHIYELDLAPPATGIPPRHIRGHKIRPASSMLISPSGNYVVVLAAQKALLVQTQAVAEKPTKFVSPEDLTCGAFHPTDDIFATGDSAGVVRVWYCLPGMAHRAHQNGVQFSHADGKPMNPEHQRQVLDSDAQPAGSIQSKTTPTTTLHWHAHPVSAVAFNAAGTTILSAGQEGVLVLWSLLSQGKQFAPRLGGPITAVSVRPPGLGREEEYWLSMEDGSVKQIGGNGRAGFRIKGSWESGRAVPSIPARSGNPSTEAPLAFHPQTNSLILPAPHPSSIQFYSPTEQTSVLELEVAPGNRVSKSAEKQIEPTRVGLVALGGEWLATSDSLEKDEEEGGLEERHLKCWLWNETRKTYTLQTVFTNPHSSTITSLAFSPAGVPSASGDNSQLATMLLSTSIDGSARLWREKRIRYKSGKVDASFVPYTLFSHNARPIYDSAWSPDGSLIALAQGSVVTLWDPVSSTLKGTLGCSEFAKGVIINHVGFVGQGGRFVVGGAAKGGLVVWDLIKGEIAWSIQDKRVNQIVPSSPSSSSDTFTIVENGLGQSFRSSAYHVFSAQSAVPIESRAMTEHIRSIVPYPSSAENTDSDEGKRTFAVLSDRWKVLIVGEDANGVLAVPSRSPQVVGASTGTGSKPVGATLFDEIFGPSPSSSKGPAVPVQREDGGRRKYKDLDEMFEAPAQVLPPMGMVFDEVYEECMAKRGTGEEEEEEEEGEGEGMELDELEDGQGEVERSAVLEVRAVRDRDVHELVDLFRDILAAPTPTSSAPPKPNGLPKGKGGSLSSSTTGTPARAIPAHMNMNGSLSTLSTPTNKNGTGTEKSSPGSSTPSRSAGKKGRDSTSNSNAGTPGSVGGSGKKRKAKD